MSSNNGLSLFTPLSVTSMNVSQVNEEYIKVLLGMDLTIDPKKVMAVLEDINNFSPSEQVAYFVTSIAMAFRSKDEAIIHRLMQLFFNTIAAEGKYVVSSESQQHWEPNKYRTLLPALQEAIETYCEDKNNAEQFIAVFGKVILPIYKTVKCGEADFQAQKLFLTKALACWPLSRRFSVLWHIFESNWDRGANSELLLNFLGILSYVDISIFNVIKQQLPQSPIFTQQNPNKGEEFVKALQNRVENLEAISKKQQAALGADNIIADEAESIIKQRESAVGALKQEIVKNRHLLQSANAEEGGLGLARVALESKVVAKMEEMLRVRGLVLPNILWSCYEIDEDGINTDEINFLFSSITIQQKILIMRNVLGSNLLPNELSTQDTLLMQKIFGEEVWLHMASAFLKIYEQYIKGNLNLYKLFQKKLEGVEIKDIRIVVQKCVGNWNSLEQEFFEYFKQKCPSLTLHLPESVGATSSGQAASFEERLQLIKQEQEVERKQTAERAAKLERNILRTFSTMAVSATMPERTQMVHAAASPAASMPVQSTSSSTTAASSASSSVPVTRSSQQFSDPSLSPVASGARGILPPASTSESPTSASLGTGLSVTGGAQQELVSSLPNAVTEAPTVVIPPRELPWWAKVKVKFARFKSGWNNVGWKKRWLAIGFMVFGGLGVLAGLAMIFIPPLQIPAVVVFNIGKHIFNFGIGAIVVIAGSVLTITAGSTMMIGAAVSARELSVPSTDAISASPTISAMEHNVERPNAIDSLPRPLSTPTSVAEVAPVNPAVVQPRRS